MILEDREIFAIRKRMRGVCMAFISQIIKSKVSSSRGGADVRVTQSYKPSSNVQELSFRITAKVLSRAGMKIGDFVDVMYDDDTSQWMIKKVKTGLKITGKLDAPSGLVRYTLKEGHMKFTNERSLLPIVKNSISESIEHGDNYLIFKLNMEDENEKSKLL